MQQLARTKFYILFCYVINIVILYCRSLKHLGWDTEDLIGQVTISRSRGVDRPKGRGTNII